MRNILSISLLLLSAGCASTPAASSAATSSSRPASTASTEGRSIVKPWDHPDCLEARARARDSRLLPTDTIYGPNPISILMPPLPVPNSLKKNGINILFTMRVDSAGNVIPGKSSTSPQIADKSYQRKLNEMMAGWKFRAALLNLCQVEGTHTLRWQGA